MQCLAQKKQFLSFIIFTFSCFGIAAAQEGMHFEKGTFAEAKAKAKKEHKLIFMDCYTTWCGPCKSMSSKTFTDSKVGEFYNSKFINTKFDMEDGEGVDLAKTYQVMCYPNLLILDEDGKLLHRAAGYKGVQEFIEFAQTGLNPKERFAALQQQYEENKTNKDIVGQYLNQLDNTCLPKDEVAKVYLSMLSESDLKDAKNWSVITTSTTDFESPAFKYILSNISYYESAHTKDSVRNYVMGVLYEKTGQIANDESFTEQKFNDFLNKLKNLKLSFVKEEDLFNLKLFLYEARKSWKDYIRVAMTDGDRLITPGLTNTICWNFYLNATEKAEYAKAESWMKKYIAGVKDEYDWVMGTSKTLPKKIVEWDVDPSMFERAKAYLAENDLYPQYDTYAALQYRLKKKNEAIQNAEIAISIAKKFELDDSGTKTLLEDIKKLK